MVEKLNIFVYYVVKGCTLDPPLKFQPFGTLIEVAKGHGWSVTDPEVRELRHVFINYKSVSGFKN